MMTIKIAESGFSVIENEIFRNKEISARAKGVYAYFRTCSPDWTIRLTTLSQFFMEGREAIRTAVNELEEWGYIKRERIAGDGKKISWQMTVFATSQGSMPQKPVNGKPVNGKPVDIISTKNKHKKSSPPTSSLKETPEAGENGLKPLGEVKVELRDFISIFPDRSPTARDSLYELLAIVEETLEREALSREELLTALRECRAIQDNWTANDLQYKRGLKSILQNDTWKDIEFWETRVDPAKRATMNQKKRDQKVNAVKSKRAEIIKKFIQRAHHGENLAELESELYKRGLPHSYISDFTTAVQHLATA